MMPPVALVIPYYVLFQSTGLLGSLGGGAVEGAGGEQCHQGAQQQG